jgi:hypothetical protein
MPALRVPDLRRVLPDLAAFVLGLGCAHLLGWNATSLVWSLWLGSLTVGYLTILSLIGRGVFFGSVVIFHPEFPAGKRPAAIAVGGLAALFLLGFFSLHFCGFHSVHASFLSSFFPLEGVPRNALWSTFMNPVALWKFALAWVAPKFGLFVIPVILAERLAIFGWVGTAVSRLGHLQTPEAIAALAQSSFGSARASLSRPYLNVMRMHGLIIFFGICHLAKIDSVPVFVVTYAVYFFPWSAFRAAPPAQIDAPALSATTKQPSMRHERSG